MSGLQVMSSGMLSLIQDLGRYGVARHGLSAGGPADLHAHCWANQLLDNPSNASVLEITMGNASFLALDDILISLTGADTNPQVDGESIATWRSFLLRKGQTLKLGYAKTGFRSYLAVAGGIDAPKVFGSSATVVRNQLGGLGVQSGRAIQKGDILPVCKTYTNDGKPFNWVPRLFIPKYSDEVSLSVIESYQSHLFSRQAKQTFYANPYQISDKSDRMGIRLQGNPVQMDLSGVISEGIAYGSIQFPSNGQPIILLNDRQTLGGYPKIGCVSRMSLMKLAQARPGSLIHFYRGDIERETEAYCEFMKFFSL
ncbi:urea amidolyase [Vibrio diazotrophicus]|uniref:Urea amidolyase n=1 Tax=Vibrio diazotrophicus TaxID=685 RepID=A0A2J8HWD5_VIBDI|nr:MULTISPECIES: biotin-dependent carboxyltransferase family protein [Vibrio]MCF7363757.1 biotin-dependent carboxyltransferase family protein [Vibrio sp. A1-b2]PNI02583.1 urea amidolyase [Vibrio diazotrophicus]